MIHFIKKKNIFIIAEAGTGHGGDIEKAKELINQANDAKIDCVKFQYVIADEILHIKSGLIKLPKGEINLYNKFKDLEQPSNFYQILFNYCKAKNIEFLCSPFGKRSMKNLLAMGVSAIKIASPESNYYPLMDLIWSYRLPTIISTGVSQQIDIEHLMDYLIHKKVQNNICLLQCITQYPSPENEYNLLTIPSWYYQYGVLSGLSDHTIDKHRLPMIALMLALIYNYPCIIEKHLTLDKLGEQLDDPIALNQSDFKSLKLLLENINTDYCNSLNKEMKKIFKEIKSQSEHLGIYLAWQSNCRKEWVEAISYFLSAYESISAQEIEPPLGDGIKKLTYSEKDNYLTTNRSLIAIRDIIAGEKLSSANCQFLRSEKNLKPGMSCREYYESYGKYLFNTSAEQITCLRNFVNGDAICLDDISL